MGHIWKTSVFVLLMLPAYVYAYVAAVLTSVICLRLCSYVLVKLAFS